MSRRSLAVFGMLSLLGAGIAESSLSFMTRATEMAARQSSFQRSPSALSIEPVQQPEDHSTPLLTLAVKYVAYQDQGSPVVNQLEAEEIIAEANRLFQPCKIAFRLEEFLTPSPSVAGLAFNPSRMAELSQIRRAFDDPRYLVIVNTGKWNREGGLGADGANAWTAMPGSAPAGAVIEGDISKGAGLVAHEIGHYLDLDHDLDETNLMHPVIYDSSTTLDELQCNLARDAAVTHWESALRFTGLPKPAT